MAQAKTQRELAERLRKSESTVRKWLSDRRWPFAKVPPWDVEKVQQWRETAFGSNAGEFESPDDKKTRRLRNEKLELEIANLRSDTVPREEYVKALDGLATLFVRILTNMQAAFPDLLSHKSSGEIADSIQVMFDGGREQLVAKADDEIERVTGQPRRRRRPGRPRSKRK